jgi:uncharacterized protein (TIGR03382 family)
VAASRIVADIPIILILVLVLVVWVVARRRGR